jgi:hypothetical protein
MLRFPHFVDNRLTDGGEVVSLTRRPIYFKKAVHFPYRLVSIAYIYIYSPLLYFKENQGEYSVAVNLYCPFNSQEETAFHRQLQHCRCSRHFTVHCYTHQWCPYSITDCTSLFVATNFNTGTITVSLNHTLQISLYYSLLFTAGLSASLNGTQ